MGEAGYGLGGLKEVEVTEWFLGMERAVTQCQQGETLAACQTRRYRAAAEEQCGCLPFSLKDYHHSHNKVSTQSVWSISMSRTVPRSCSASTLMP